MSGPSAVLMEPPVERPDLSRGGFVVSRSAEADRLAAYVMAHKTRLVILSGPAASGKTVLLTRWLIPALRAAAEPSGFVVCYGKCVRGVPETFSAAGHDEAFDDLLARRSIIIIDEFDRVFALTRDERRAQLDTLFAKLERAHPDTRLVVVVSEQYLTSMYALNSYDPAIVNSVCEIKPVGLADGLEQLASEDADGGLTYANDVLDRLREESQELERKGIDVTFDLLKLLHERFRREAKETGVERIDTQQYEKIGGLLGVVREHVSVKLDKLEADRPGSDRVARAILQRVLEAQTRGHPADFAEIAPRFEVSSETVTAMVNQLTAPEGLLFRIGPDQYEFQPPQVAAVIEEDAALRQMQNERAARIIEEGLRSRQQLGTFLPAARFTEIHRQRSRLVVNDEMARFLVQCALRDEAPGNAAAEYWLRRVTSREDAMDVLLTAAFDPSAVVRERVAWLLGAYPEALVRERLSVLALSDASEVVRYAAVESLAHMANDELLQRLLQEVNKANAPYRQAAIEALRIFPRSEVAAVLQSLVADPTSDLTLRTEAVDVLAMLNIDQSVDALIDIALNDSDGDDRTAAARALSNTASEPLNHRILEQLDWRRPTVQIVVAAVVLALGLTTGALLGGLSMFGLVLATRSGLGIGLLAITIATGVLLMRLRDGRTKWRSPLGFVALGLYGLCAITVLPIVHGLAHMMVKRYRRGLALLGLEALGIFMYAVLSGATEFVPVPGLGFLAMLYRVIGVLLFVGSYLYDVVAVAFRTVLFRHAMTREERRGAIYRETFRNPVMADAVFADLRGTEPAKARRAKRLIRRYGGSMQPSKLLQMLTAADASYRPYVVWALRDAKDDAAIATLEKLARTARRTQQFAIAAVLGGNPTPRSIDALRRVASRTGVFLRVLAVTATLRFRLSVWPWSARLAVLALVPAMGVLLYHGAKIRANPAWSEIVTLRQPLPSATQKVKIVNFLVDAYPVQSDAQLRQLFHRHKSGADSLHAAIVRGLVVIQDSIPPSQLTNDDRQLRGQLAGEAPKFVELLKRDSSDFSLWLDVLRVMAKSNDSVVGPVATGALVRYVNEDTSYSGISLQKKQEVVRVLGAVPFDRGLPALDTLLKTRVSDKVQSKNRAAGAFSDSIRGQIVQTARQANVRAASGSGSAARLRLLEILNKLDVASPELTTLKRDVQQATQVTAGCDRNADGVCDGKDEALKVIAESPALEDGYRDLLSHFTLATQFRAAVDTFELLKTRYPTSIWPRKILSEMYHESRAVQDQSAFDRAYAELTELRAMPAYDKLRAKSPEDFVRIESDFVEGAVTSRHYDEAESVARALLAKPPAAVDRLNMSLFIYIAAVMQPEKKTADARLSELESVVRSLPAAHYNNWVYPGTTAFIDRSELSPQLKTALKKFCKEGQWYTPQQAAAVVAENRAALAGVASNRRS